MGEQALHLRLPMFLFPGAQLVGAVLPLFGQGDGLIDERWLRCRHTGVASLYYSPDNCSARGMQRNQRDGCREGSGSVCGSTREQLKQSGRKEGDKDFGERTR